MERVGVRELRQKASEILRRVAAGETFEITDRGRPAAILSSPGPSGLAEMERRGLIRRAEGDLLDVVPVRMPKGKRKPSDLVSEGRGS
jgi:prevent-host-death family protein